MFVYHQLQQFRQKKDNKGTGSHGKSAKNSGKLEQRELDAYVESTVAKPTSLSSVSEGEIASGSDSALPTVGSSTSHSMDNVPPDAYVAVDDLSAVPSARESSLNETITGSNELSTPRVGDSEHDVDSQLKNEGTGPEMADVEVARVMSSVDSDAMSSGGETNSSNPTVPTDLLLQPASVDSPRVAVTVESQSLDPSENESLLPQEDTHASLTQAREDQVTDLGCSLLLLLLLLILFFGLFFICFCFGCCLGFVWGTFLLQKCIGFEKPSWIRDTNMWI